MAHGLLRRYQGVSAAFNSPRSSFPHLVRDVIRLSRSRISPPRRPRSSRKTLGLGLLAAFALLLAEACTETQRPAVQSPASRVYWSNSPKQCALDEVREYFCDELVPLSSPLPPADPYDDCPGSLERHTGLHYPLPPVALFDRHYTGYIRKRMPPGNSCCYSWCGPIRIVSLSEVSPNAGCNGPLAFRESYCLEEPESGTSSPMNTPFERCPVAIAPPEGAAFSVPRAAPFDPQVSHQRRQQGFKQCCYGWCSMAPAGTGVENL